MPPRLGGDQILAATTPPMVRKTNTAHVGAAAGKTATHRNLSAFRSNAPRCTTLHHQPQAQLRTSLFTSRCCISLRGKNTNIYRQSTHNPYDLARASRVSRRDQQRATRGIQTRKHDNPSLAKNACPWPLISVFILQRFFSKGPKTEQPVG